MLNCFDLKRKRLKRTQTDDLTFHLTNKKTVRMYYSQASKEKVMSLNFGTSKNFIITKHMWKILKRNLTK